jgi:hypothetical protein
MFVYSSDGAGFALLLEDGETVEKMHNLGSSKGTAKWWVISKKGRDYGTTLCHAVIPFDKENSLEEGLEAFRSASLQG